jgi:hypothetical protein
MTQVVRPTASQAGRRQTRAEPPAAPLLESVRRPDPATVAREGERAAGRVAGLPAPRAQVVAQRLKQPDGRRRRVFSAVTSTVRPRTSLQRRMRRSPGRSPAYPSRDTIAASRSLAAAARIRSIVIGASGRTSSAIGSGARRTTRCGLYAIRRPSAARCRIAPEQHHRLADRMGPGTGTDQLALEDRDPLGVDLAQRHAAASARYSRRTCSRTSGASAAPGARHATDPRSSSHSHPQRRDTRQRT